MNGLGAVSVSPRPGCRWSPGKRKRAGQCELRLRGHCGAGLCSEFKAFDPVWGGWSNAPGGRGRGCVLFPTGHVPGVKLVGAAIKVEEFGSAAVQAAGRVGIAGPQGFCFAAALVPVVAWPWDESRVGAMASA